MPEGLDEADQRRHVLYAEARRLEQEAVAIARNPSPAITQREKTLRATRLKAEGIGLRRAVQVLQEHNLL